MFDLYKKNVNSERFIVDIDVHNAYDVNKLLWMLWCLAQSWWIEWTCPDPA